MDGVSAAGLSAAEFAGNYEMALLKKTMDSMANQAESLISAMLEAVPLPAPSQYGFDVYG